MKAQNATQQTKPAESKTPRTRDAFQTARGIYLARKRLFDKAAALLDDADENVRALVEAHEETDAGKVIEALPVQGEQAAAE